MELTSLPKMVRYLLVVSGKLVLALLASTVIQGSESRETDMSLLSTDTNFPSFPSSANDIVAFAR
jgi:hypothetical protein